MASLINSAWENCQSQNDPYKFRKYPALEDKTTPRKFVRMRRVIFGSEKFVELIKEGMKKNKGFFPKEK